MSISFFVACGAISENTRYGCSLSHAHDFSLQIIKKRYLASEATCETPKKYFYVCECKATGKETFEYGSELGHSYTKYVYNDDASKTQDGTEDATCDNGCGQKQTRIAEGSAGNGTHTFTYYTCNQETSGPLKQTMTASCDCGCGKTLTKKHPPLTTIKVEYLYTTYGTTVFEKIGTEFMKRYPYIRISLIANDSINDELPSNLEKNKYLSDVYYSDFLGLVRRWVTKGYVEPLDDLFDSKVGDGEGVTVSENISSQVLKSMEMYAGGFKHYWSLPQNLSMGSFVYNKKLFDKYGLNVPTTTKELIEFCETVSEMELYTEKGVPITPINYCGAEDDAYWNEIIHTWWLQASGKETLDEFSKFETAEIYKDQGRLRTYQVFNEIAFNPDYIPKTVYFKDKFDAQKDFLEGEAFIITCGAWFEKEMEDWIPYYNDVCDYRIMRIPTLCDEDGNKITETQYLWDSSQDAWFIPSANNEEKKMAAKVFLSFMASDTASELWTKYAGSICAYNYDYSSSSQLYESLNDFQKGVCELASSSTLYRMNFENPVAFFGFASTFPWTESPFIAFRDKIKTPEEYFETEYSYARSQWEIWELMLKDL